MSHVVYSLGCKSMGSMYDDDLNTWLCNLMVGWNKLDETLINSGWLNFFPYVPEEFQRELQSRIHTAR